MGNSDYLIIPEQIGFLDLLLNKEFIQTKEALRIAFLGNPNENATVKHYQEKFPHAQIKLYDLLLENWDINKEWNIENYDIVICHRTTSFANPSGENGRADFFFEELKKCISSNKYVIFDFYDAYTLLLDRCGIRHHWEYEMHGSTRRLIFKDERFAEHGIEPTFAIFKSSFQMQYYPIKEILTTYMFWDCEMYDWLKSEQKKAK